MFVLYLYVFALLIRPQDWLWPFVGLPIISILLPIGLMLALVAKSKHKESIPVYQIPILFLYLLVTILSTLINTDFLITYQYAVLFVQRILTFVIFVWLIRSPKELKSIIIFTLGVISFIAFQMVIQGLTGEAVGGLKSYSDSTIDSRAMWYGDWDGPNVVSIIFVVSFAICLEFILNNKYDIAQRIPFLIFIILDLMALYYSNSRGAILAMLVIVLYRIRNHLFNLKVLFTILITGIISFRFLPSRVHNIDSKEASAGERIWTWEQGLNFYRENPVFGLGRGQFEIHNTLGLVAHNNYVQNFSELGSLGFFLFLAMFWFCFKGNYSVGQREVNTSNLSNDVITINRGLETAIIAFSAITFFVVMELDMLYVLLALSTSAYLVACRDDATVKRPSFNFFDIKIILAGMFAILLMVWAAAILEIL